MTVYGIGGDQLLANLQRHARIALAAMPVRVIVREPALLRDLRRLGFQFLQAHHVRPIAPQPFPHLGRAGPDAVDIPGGDFHALARYKDNLRDARPGPFGTAPLIACGLRRAGFGLSCPPTAPTFPSFAPPQLLTAWVR